MIDDSSLLEPIFRAISLPFGDYCDNNESLHQSFKRKSPQRLISSVKALLLVKFLYTFMYRFEQLIVKIAHTQDDHNIHQPVLLSIHFMIRGLGRKFGFKMSFSFIETFLRLAFRHEQK